MWVTVVHEVVTGTALGRLALAEGWREGVGDVGDVFGAVIVMPVEVLADSAREVGLGASARPTQAVANTATAAVGTVQAQPRTTASRRRWRQSRPRAPCRIGCSTYLQDSAASPMVAANLQPGSW